MSAYKNPPEFNSSGKPYERYIEEVKAWELVTDLHKDKKGLALALSLPEHDPSGIRDKVFNEVKLENIKGENGVKTLITFMDKLFKKDDLSDTYEKYTLFNRYQRTAGIKMEDFVIEFEKLYNKSKNKDMELPQAVLMFKLLDASNLSHGERMIVLTGVDYDKKDTLFTQMKASLKKFHGDQAYPGAETNFGQKAIKTESAYAAYEEEEEAYYSGYRRNPFHRGKSRGGYFNYGDRGRGKKYDETRPSAKKHMNPLGNDGRPLRCTSCDSVRHFMKDCPHSYENSEKAYEVEEDVVLFTGANPNELCLLASEARNSAVLDSACTSNVAGRNWMNCYFDSMSPESQAKVKRSTPQKVFRFGGGEKKKSVEVIEFPCEIAGKRVTIRTDIVDSDLPLLLSKDAMKSAKVKLDLEDDSAHIFGKKVSLDCTSSGHYSIPIKDSKDETEICIFTLEHRSIDEKKKIISKLHKQFAHPSQSKLIALMKDAKAWDEDCLSIINELYQRCDICKRFTKTPPRPVVCLPLASSFNEAVAMDLKVWRNNLYILYLMDMFTRLTKGVWIKNKLPDTIIKETMRNWVGAGFGYPKKFLADNGGEFANDNFRDMCQNLNVEVLNTAARSPWMNGMMERNHAVVDRMIEKLLEDDPNMPLEIALSSALNAKNSLAMWNGFSSYQLVYGQNPNIPSVLVDNPPALEGRTTSEVFAKNLNALHSARSAFIEAETSEKIRRALRHKIRVSSENLKTGDKVYFKRDDSNRWSGPGTIIGCDGKVYFVRHGSVYIRVSSNRILKANDASNLNRSDTDEEEDKEISRSDVEREPPNLIADSDDDENSVTSSNRNVIPAIETNDEEHDVESNNTNTVPIVDTNDDESGANISSTNRNTGQIELPNKADRIRYKIHDQGWKEADVLSRGGKSSGMNRSWINLKNVDEEKAVGVDFDQVEEWTKINPEEVHIIQIPRSRHGENEVVMAKKKEIENWQKFQVYEEVDDKGQNCITTTWVITEKRIDGQMGIKARLVARGFEDQEVVQTDSPTAAKSTLRILICIAGKYSWHVKSTDIKAAFLQGRPIERDIYLEPPAIEKKEGIIWKLKKVVYGLSDASRNWYQSVCEKMIGLGCKKSKYDPTLFFYCSENGLEGIFLSHVDDFIHAGTKLFEERVLHKIKESFQIGKIERYSFKYIGWNIKSSSEHTTVDQADFIEKLEEIPITVKRASNKHDSLNKQERKQLRAAIGQCNWVASQTRPDISYDVIELSMICNDPLVQHIVNVNKVIKKLKLTMCQLMFPKLVGNLKIVVYSDASHANLPDKASSAGAYVIFLVDDEEKCCILSWSANKIKRVVRSTTAAEALALNQGLEDALYLECILSEVLNIEAIPIYAFTDSRNLYESLHSTKPVEEKRLRIDIATLQEMIQKREVTRIDWIPGDCQLADCLTKRGASCQKLINVLNSGVISD